MFRLVTLFILLSSFQLRSENSATIVVLGSSTAKGFGAVDSSNSWANRLSKYLKRIDSSYSLINLAVSGYTTCQLMPNDYKPPIENKNLTPDVNANITKALSLNPKIIIINTGSNDIVKGIKLREELSNFKALIDLCKRKNVGVWITSPQPRYMEPRALNDSLFVLKDSIFNMFGNHVIDFWNDFVRDKYYIINKYDCGDGVHQNDFGHEQLFNKVLSAGLLFNIDSTKIQKNSFIYDINIDFGRQSTHYEWNTIDRYEDDDFIYDLKDSNGNQTSVQLSILNPFTGIIRNDSPVSFSRKSNFYEDIFRYDFFGNNSVTGSKILLTGLKPNEKLNFNVFVSFDKSFLLNDNSQFDLLGNLLRIGKINNSVYTNFCISYDNVSPSLDGTIILKTSCFDTSKSDRTYRLSGISFGPNAELITDTNENKESDLIYFSTNNNITSVEFYTSNYGKYSIEIISIDGKCIKNDSFQSDVGKNVIQLKNLTKGIYFIRLIWKNSQSRFGKIKV